MAEDNLTKDWRIELREWLKDNSKVEANEFQELRAQFLQRFPKEKLGELTIDQYAEGLGSKDTFCYWLEFKTRQLGSIRGGSALKFGVWWSRHDNNWKWQKRYHGPEDAFAQFRRAFIELCLAVEAHRYHELDEIRSRYLGPGSRMVPVKVLSLYFPDEFLPILSNGDLSYYTRIFGMTPAEGVIANNRRLMQALQSLPEFQGFDTRQIGRFLWTRFAPPRGRD